MKTTNKPIDQFLFVGWAASVIATLGSLYFSEIMKFIPCELCWFQRIFMYPLAVILGIAVVKKDYRISLYSMVLPGIGGTISIYHYLIQKVPFFKEHSISCGMIPCTDQYINWLGFITIPFLALVAFIIIFVVSFYIYRNMKEGM
jgi:disulfide bond formation protein DsbB